MAKQKSKLNLHLKKGALHEMLGIPKDEEIPMDELIRAAHSKNPKLRKRALFAISARGWKKG